MKKFIAGIVISLALIGGVAVFAQDTNEWIGHMRYRQSSPNISWNGTASFVNATTGAGGSFYMARPTVTTAATALTLTNLQCGRVINATHATLAQTFTLPSAATAGCTFTFIAGNAGGEILITPITAQSINMRFFATAVPGAITVLAPAAGTGVKNTAATNVLGDTVTLVSDGITTWYNVAHAVGIWASQ